MPIFTFIATVVLGLTAGTFLAGAVAAGLGIIASIGLNYAIKALSGTPQAADTTSHFSTQGQLQSGGDVPRSFNLGYSSTAGSLVYANTFGTSGSGSSATPNCYLTQVIAISDLPGGSLVEVWVNGELVTLDGGGDVKGQGVNEYKKAGADHLWIKYHDGTQTTADSWLVSQFAAAPGRPWGSTRVGTGVAYVIATALIEDTLFTGFPTFKFAVSGIPLYDPTKDSTNGGSGSHRYSTPSTWGGDGDNFPAVQAYNVLRGINYAGSWLYGPQNMTEARLPTVNWNAQIDKCRATILGVSGYEPTYRSGGQIGVNTQPVLALEAILTACQGRISELGGFYKIHLGTPDSTSFYFTDDNILSTEAQNFTPFFSLADSVNGITASYPSPAAAWATTVAPPYFRTDLETLDGSRRLLANPSFDFVPYDAQVQRLMKSAVQEAQRARRHTLVLPPEYWIIEPGDIGEWTSVRNGYTSKQFRVDGIIDKANLDVSTNITEVDPSDYAWTHATDFTPVTVGPTVFYRPPAQDVGSWTATGQVIFDSDGVSRRPAIQLGWDGSQPGISAIQFEVKLKSSGVVVARGRTDQYSIGALIISESLLPNTVYQARGAYIPSSPRDVTWSDYIDVTTPDVRFSLADFEAGLAYQVTGLQQKFEGQIADLEQTFADLLSDISARQHDNKYIGNQQAWDHRADLLTQIGVINATVSTLATAESSTATAFASYQTTVNATLGTLNSTVTTQSSAIATLNGYAAAQYSVTLDVNGYASGFSLLNGGANFSTFTIVADKFQIQLPGYNGSAPYPFFTTGTVNGTASVGIRGNMFLDGTLNANRIVAGSITSASGVIGALGVTSLSIGDNAVTVPASQSLSTGITGTSTSTYITNVSSVTLSINTAGLTGKTIAVSANFLGIMSFTADTVFARARMMGALNGGSQTTMQEYVQFVGVPIVTFPLMGLYTFTATGGTDSVVISIDWNGLAYASGFATTLTLGTRNLTATASKR